MCSNAEWKPMLRVLLGNMKMLLKDDNNENDVLTEKEQDMVLKRCIRKIVNLDIVEVSFM